MTREERLKRVEELEQELSSTEREEIAKHNKYYDKMIELKACKDNEQIEKLKQETSKLSQELVDIAKKKVDIRMELRELSKDHKLLQYAKVER